MHLSAAEFCIACVTDTKFSFSVHLFIRRAHTTIVTDRRQRSYLLRFVCDVYDHRVKAVASGYGLKPDLVGPGGGLANWPDDFEVVVGNSCGLKPKSG